MNWPQLANWIFKNRHEFVIVIVAVASFVVVWPIGDYGILDDWAFVKSLEHLHTKGRLVVLDWNPMSLTGHLVWGLLFTMCFGFSFTVTKIAEFCAGLFLALIVCRLPKRYGVHPILAMFAGLAVLLNPLVLVHSFMFMTDVTALLWQWLSVASLLLGLEKFGRRRTGLLIAGSIFWALAVLTRQHGITVPVAFAAYVFLCDRRSLRLDIIVPFFLPGIWLAANGLELHYLVAGTNQSFQASSELVREFVLNPWWVDLPYICWSYAVYIGLFAIPLVLSIRWRDLPNLTTGRVVVMFLSIWVGVLLYVHYSIKGWYFPYIRNVVTPWGMFQPHEFVIGERDVLWDREWGMSIGLCGICAFFGWLALIFQRQLPSTHGESGIASDPKLNIRSLLLLLFGCQFAYTLATAPILFDRHLLLLVPTAILLVAFTAPPTPPRRFLPATLLMGYAAYGITCTHDLHAISRAVFLAGQQLLAAGVPADEIDAGYAFDGWYMYERSQTISRSPTMRIPPWWPTSHKVTASSFKQPWWIYGLVTEIRPKYVVSLSSPIPLHQFDGAYEYEEIEYKQSYWTYWPLKEHRIHVFRTASLH